MSEWKIHTGIVIVILLVALVYRMAVVADVNEQSRQGVIVHKGSKAAHAGLTVGNTWSNKGSGVVLLPEQVPDRYWLVVESADKKRHTIRVALGVWQQVKEGDYWHGN